MTKLEFDNLVNDFKSSDAMKYEDAFHIISSNLKEYKKDILTVYEKEENSRIRGRFLELIGLFKDESLIPVFEQELLTLDPGTVPWAITGLENIDNARTRVLLRSFRENHPEWL